MSRDQVISRMADHTAFPGGLPIQYGPCQGRPTRPSPIEDAERLRGELGAAGQSMCASPPLVATTVPIAMPPAGAATMPGAVVNPTADAGDLLDAWYDGGVAARTATDDSLDRALSRIMDIRAQEHQMRG